MGERITINHNRIRQWIEKNGGKPAVIDVPESDLREKGIRVDFPGRRNRALLSQARPSLMTSWDMFFRIFDEKNLAFVYVAKPKFVDMSLSYRFVNRENMEDEVA